jgi:hypothetical protein
MSDTRETLRPDAVLARNPRVAYRELNDGSGVLLHLDTGAYHGLNDVGSLVWGALENQLTLSALILEIRSRFEGAPPTVADDVRSFVSDLVDRDLLTVKTA